MTFSQLNLESKDRSLRPILLKKTFNFLSTSHVKSVDNLREIPHQIVMEYHRNTAKIIESEMGHQHCKTSRGLNPDYKYLHTKTSDYFDYFHPLLRF